MSANHAAQAGSLIKSTSDPDVNLDQVLIAKLEVEYCYIKHTKSAVCQKNSGK